MSLFSVRTFLLAFLVAVVATLGAVRWSHSDTSTASTNLFALEARPLLRAALLHYAAKREEGESSADYSHAFSLPDSVEYQTPSNAAFANIRRLWGVDLGSLLSNISFHDYQAHSASDSAFLLSADGKLFVKSLADEELLFLLERTLQPYTLHLEAHPDSLLCRMLAVISITGHSDGKVTFASLQHSHWLLMQNALHGPVPTAVLFDLKGSISGRLASDSARHSNPPLLKDVDFIEGGYLPTSDGRWEWLPPSRIKVTSARGSVLSRLRADMDFLVSLGVSEYSLLLGRTGDRGRWTAGGEGHPLCSELSTTEVDGPSCVYLSLVDILQHYGLRQQWVRLMAVFQGWSKISVAPPQYYGQRLLSMLSQHLPEGEAGDAVS